MKTRTFAVALAALVVVSMTGVTAYTTATADRDVSVNVKNDNAGVLNIADGTVDGAEITSGTLEINAEGENLNRKATFTFGNDASGADAKTSHAFKLTNADDVAHDITYNATGTTAVSYFIAIDGNGDGTVDSTKTVSAGGTATFTLDAASSDNKQNGGVAYVVVIVDTPDSTGTESGTVKISAN